jgi:hypothetical protein
MSLKMIPGFGKSGISRTAARNWSIESESIAGTLAGRPETSTAARHCISGPTTIKCPIMKRILALILSLVAVAAVSPAQAAEMNATPETCIRNFYHWYVTNLVANRDPMKQRAEIKQYATNRLLKEIDKMTKGPEGLDGDYFTDAQDFDSLWAKNIVISDVKTTGDKSDAHVVLDGSKGMRKKLIVHLVKESGSWKVDKVKGAD